MSYKTLYFTKKQWKQFDLQKQEILTQRYQVILTDYETKKTLLIKILKNLDTTCPIGIKNLNSGIEKFRVGIDAWDKTMDVFSESLRKSTHSDDNDIGRLFGKKDIDIDQVFFGSKK